MRQTAAAAATLTFQERHELVAAIRPDRPPHYAYFARGGFPALAGQVRQVVAELLHGHGSRPLSGDDRALSLRFERGPAAQSVHTENGLFDSKSLYYVDDIYDTLERASHRIKGGLNMRLLHCNSLDITLTWKAPLLLPARVV